MVTITKYLRARPANKRFQQTKENKIDVYKSGDFFFFPFSCNRWFNHRLNQCGIGYQRRQKKRYQLEIKI